MRGSVGNSGNQGGKCLGIFRLGVSTGYAPSTLLFHLLCKMLQTNAHDFVKDVRRDAPPDSLYS